MTNGLGESVAIVGMAARVPGAHGMTFAPFGLRVLSPTVGRYVYDTLSERCELGPAGGLFHEVDRHALGGDGAS